MIKLPEFNDEEWYLEEIIKLFTDGRHSKEKREKELKEKKIKIYEVFEEIGLKEVLAEEEKDPLEQLILIPFSGLKQIYVKIKEKGYDFKEKYKENGKEKERLKEGWQYIYDVYDKLVSHKINVELVHRYGIRSCPYCNENYIFNRNKSAVAQLDHFYPRSVYPIFSVCLYNLVPACSACNNKKEEKEIGISPHDNLCDFSNLKITYMPKSANWLDDEQELEIKFSYSEKDLTFKNEMGKNLKEMKIDVAYRNHTDYLQEILKKAQIYNKENRNNLLLDFPDLFSSDDELLRILFGNYITEQELLKRPLAKLTRDILKGDVGGGKHKRKIIK